MPRDTAVLIEDVSPAQVQAWLENGEVLLVDVRETSEYEAEYIAGAMLLPLSSLDPEFFPVLPGRKVVLHCAIGKRSEAAAKMLIKAGHTGISHMTGGLNAWKDQGLETELPVEVPDVVVTTATPAHPGHVLAAEFMGPQELSCHSLATEIGVPCARIEQLIAGDMAVDSEMSLRLAQFFSTEPGFWMMLQVDYDLARAAAALAAEHPSEAKTIAS
ncbi:MAG: HigA family addiction module antidote protein [Rhodobacteraceae bacterium]|nr:HigA family addiction module antidote protein [Paracoccaceae bacterium]